MSVFDRAERIRSAGFNCARTREGRSRCDEIQFAPGYAEPGYGDAELVAFGNWNKVNVYVPAHQEQFRFPKHKNSRITRKWAKRPENLRPVQAHFKTVDDTIGRVAKLLERAGVEIEWSDEWDFCQGCGKAFRTSPDSYSWSPSYTDVQDERLCHDCTDWGEYLESVEGDHRKATSHGLDLEKYGYKLLEDKLESGWHPGQDADPKVIAKALRKMKVKRFLFSIDGKGQFDLEFSVWVHEDEYDMVAQGEWARADKDGPSNSAALDRGLRAAANTPRPEGQIVVTKINVETGTATHKAVSPEDFVNGKALE